MFEFTNLLFGTSTASGDSGSTGGIQPILLMLVLFVAMYFLMIRPQKKKEKETQQMRDSIQIGDEITTIGGIIGRVVTVKEDSIVIETGADRVKMRFQRWAIQTNETANARMEAERKAAEEAKKAKKEQENIDAAVNGRRKKKTKTVENFAAEEAAKEKEAKEKTEE